MASSSSFDALSLLALLRECPLVASVQASPGSPLDLPERLWPLAEASLNEGVRVLRLEGIPSIERLGQATSAPFIGLIKRVYPDSDVFITPTANEVDALLRTRCEVIAMDATKRTRPGGVALRDLVAKVHASGRLVLGDCDSKASAEHAMTAGCDLISTTLAGYTDESPATSGPDLGTLRDVVAASSVPVLAEGRFSRASEVLAAMRIGAAGVVVGGALNDPVKQTRTLLKGAIVEPGLVGAVDIGGTWLRFGVFSEDGRLLRSERIPLPAEPEEREDWIRAKVEASEVRRLGIASGGTIDPATGVVLEAKPIIPGHEGRRLSRKEFGVPTLALNDGLATAWGHACHPKFAGSRVATLALGTGVGCGFVAHQQLWMGAHGEYPRLNDLEPSAERTYEELLGGASLTPNPDASQRDLARYAAIRAVRTLRAMYMPDWIVLCGSVGLSGWLGLEDVAQIAPSPYGADAGLYGAAALALYPLP